MTTGKTIALTRWTSVGKVMSLLLICYTPMQNKKLKEKTIEKKRKKMFCFLERIMEDKHILTGKDCKKDTELYSDMSI